MDKRQYDIMNKLEYSTFVKIISDIPSCVFIKDTDLRYIFSSHVWGQLNSSDFVGKTDLEIRKDKENAILATKQDQQILKNGKGVDYVIKSDIDGKVSYLQLIKEPIFDNDDNIIGIVGLINDITEKTLTDQKLKESNDKLREVYEALQKRNESEKLFTASMNHELRSPLNGIIGLLSTLLEDDTLNESQYENIYHAHQSAELMLSIVNDLLDYAKLEAKEFNIMSEVISLDAMVANIDYVARRQAVEKGLEFRLINASNGQMLIGDEKRIRQIINNLLSNAVKYTEKGWVKLQIEYKENKLSIICEDSGQGISEESLKTLFDPYSRFNEKNNKYIQGTGLGMSIVKKLVEKMNGTIEVKSEVSVGTRFDVTIPLETYSAEKNKEIESNIELSKKHFMEKNDDKEKTDSLSEEKIKYIDLSKLNILCVDDVEINLRVLKAVFSSVNIDIEKALSGNAALELANEKAYDIIFMDHMMPEIDGVTAMKEIHENSAMNKTTPIVMLTGNAGEYEQELYRESGAAGYLLKPAKKEELLKIVNDLLF